MIDRFSVALLILAFAVGGCNQHAVTATGPEAQTNASATTHSVHEPPAKHYSHLDHAQPKLRTMKLWIGPEVLETELALQLVEINTGMMFRTEMGENEGMLFVLGRRPYRVSFYMKNTRVPLAAAYIDPEGRIAEIHDLQPLNEDPVFAQSDNILYVLEVNQGWFDRHKIPVGTLIRTEVGSLAETFQR